VGHGFSRDKKATARSAFRPVARIASLPRRRSRTRRPACPYRATTIAK